MGQTRGNGLEPSESPLLEPSGRREGRVGPLCTGRAAAGESKRVMIVDDRRNVADLLAVGLQAFGHHIAVAYDGPSALETAVAFRPEVAVLDIGLPGMDGYQLAERLRHTPGAEDTRLIAVTGYGYESHRIRSAEVGFAAHLVKPVHLQTLREAIEAPSPTG